jgi:hypothetical protein
MEEILLLSFIVLAVIQLYELGRIKKTLNDVEGGLRELRRKLPWQQEKSQVTPPPARRRAGARPRPGRGARGVTRERARPASAAPAAARADERRDAGDGAERAAAARPESHRTGRPRHPAPPLELDRGGRGTSYARRIHGVCGRHHLAHPRRHRGHRDLHRLLPEMVH